MKYAHNMQNLESDCGIAVIKTILEQNKLDNNRSNSEINVELNHNGLSIDDIITQLEQFGVTSSCYEVLELEEIKKISTSFIAMIRSKELSHFIVVHNYNSNLNEFTISDPGQPHITKLSYQEFSKEFLHYIILIENVSPKGKKKRNQKKVDTIYIPVLKNINIKTKVELALIVLVRFFLPLGFYELLQTVLSESFENLTGQTSILYIVYYVCFFLGSYLIGIRYTKLQLEIENSLQKKVIDDFYTLNMSSLESKDNMSNILGYLTTLIGGATGVAKKFFFKIDIAFCLFLVIFLSRLHFSFPLIFILISYIYIVYISSQLKKIINYQKNVTFSNNAMLTTFESHILGSLDINVFKKNDSAKKNLQSKIHHFFEAKYLEQLLQNKISVAASISTFSILLSVLLVTFVSLQYFKTTLYPLSSGMYVFFIIVGLLDTISSNYLSYKMAMISIEYVQSIKNFSNLELSSTNNDNLSTITTFNKLELQSIKFSYDNSTEVLSNINLKLQTGKIIAIKGGNGSGKTTLTKLLLGLLPPNEGSFVINSQSIPSLVSTNILDYSTYYSPEEFIFQGTVQSNITMELFEDTLSKNYNSIFTTTLPAEYRTFSTGNNLSQGQKQKILLDRCMNQENKLLYILDEPTGNLDSQSKHELIQHIIKLKKQNKIIVVITHDEDLLRECDTIKLMREGALEDVKI